MNSIHQLKNTDLQLVITLLNSFGLAVSDLETAPVDFFGIKKSEKILVLGALEKYGPFAILRSVAVKQELHNKGYGKQMVKYLENKAMEQGITQLYLLTVTAERFFRKLNYQPVNRNKCPAVIQSSEEFKNICPSTAICLFKNLNV